MTLLDRLNQPHKNEIFRVLLYQTAQIMHSWSCHQLIVLLYIMIFTSKICIVRLLIFFFLPKSKKETIFIISLAVLNIEFLQIWEFIRMPLGVEYYMQIFHVSAFPFGILRVVGILFYSIHVFIFSFMLQQLNKYNSTKAFENFLWRSFKSTTFYYLI